MIKKEWIQKLKNNYEYDLLETIFKEKLLKFEYIKDYNSLSEDIIDEIIEYLPNEYIKKINEKEKINKNDFILNEEFINSFEINNENKKSLKYIKNFEIVGSDVILPLIKLYNNLSNNYLEGECFTAFSKVIIMFNDINNNLYYEIGKIIYNNLFEVDYLLDFDRQLSCNDILNIILDFNDF